uniref:Cuticlin C-terminal domain-containing protein n=1 Tax=Panagrolaimus superbus TaxID=310955 RepID=A0A914YL74_9BILA
MIVYLLISSYILMATIISGFVRNIDNFSDVITSDVSVIMDELNIINNYPNFTSLPQCQLTLHRKLCTNPAIKAHETVGWDTRICFNWKCLNTSEFVMRVESCWTGSIHNPVFLIDENGCSLEKTMIRSPRYYANLTQAHSLGWLSVRLVGSKHIRFMFFLSL